MKLRNRLRLVAMWWFAPYEYRAIRIEAKELRRQRMQPPEGREREYCIPCLKRWGIEIPPGCTPSPYGKCSWCGQVARIYRHRPRDSVDVVSALEFADWSEDGILEHLIEKRRKG